MYCAEANALGKGPVVFRVRTDVELHDVIYILEFCCLLVVCIAHNSLDLCCSWCRFHKLP
jgi:hypothetical protein